MGMEAMNRRNKPVKKTMVKDLNSTMEENKRKRMVADMVRNL